MPFCTINSQYHIWFDLFLIKYYSLKGYWHAVQNGLQNCTFHLPSLLASFSPTIFVSLPTHSKINIFPAIAKTKTMSGKAVSHCQTFDNGYCRWILTYEWYVSCFIILRKWSNLTLTRSFSKDFCTRQLPRLGNLCNFWQLHFKCIHLKKILCFMNWRTAIWTNNWGSCVSCLRTE